MLRRRQALAIPTLIDATLMGVDYLAASPEAVKRYYNAALDTGALVQLPAQHAPLLDNSLVPERTLLAASTDSQNAASFTGMLSDTNRPWQTCVMKDCALDTETFPEADAYRLPVDAALFLTDYQSLFIRLLSRAPKRVVLCAQGNTAFATALSVSFLRLGGAGAAAAMLGAGGYASLAEIAMTLYLQGMGKLNPKALRKAGQAWESLTGSAIPPYQPVIGQHIFDVSSGVHVNGLLKDGESYEPFPPEAVERERRIMLDQHSGLSAVAARLFALGIPAQAVNLALLTQRVRALGREQGEVNEQAFEALIRQAQEDVCA